MSVAALIRVSTELQTVENQRAPILAWAGMNQWPVSAVQFYEEDGVSGIAKKRPVRDALLAACRAGQHEVVCVAALDRIGRSASEVVLIVDEFSKLGVRLVSLREGLDFSTTIGQMIASVLAFIAQLEREVLSQRTKAAFERRDGVLVARKSGKKCGIRGLEWTAQNDLDLRVLTTAGTSPETIAKTCALKVGRWRMLDADGGIATKTRQPGVRWGLVSCVPSPRAMRARLVKLGTAAPSA